MGTTLILLQVFFLPTNDPEHLFSLLNRRTKNGVQSCQYCSESLLMKVFSCSRSSLYDNMTKLTEKNNEYCGQWCLLWPTIPLQDPIDCLTNHKQEETSWGFILFNVKLSKTFHDLKKLSRAQWPRGLSAFAKQTTWWMEKKKQISGNDKRAIAQTGDFP